MLEIRLLGQFNLMLDGNLVEIPSRPAQSLLAYLALTAGIAHRREKLAGMLWPDVPEADARRNLRRALWHIRKALEGRTPLQADDITVAFIADPDVWVDAHALSKKPVGDWTVEALGTAVSAYGGELLPGFYDEWVIVEREQLQAVFEGRIKLLLDRLVAAQDWEAVLGWGERWIARTGAPEPAYRAMMVAYAGQGDLSGVGHTYQRCVEALSRDLGVEPSLETQELFETLSRRGPGQAPTTSRVSSPPRPAEVHPSVLMETDGRGAFAVEPTGLSEPEEITQYLEPPFKGLQYFDEADSDLFFGREAVTAKLLERLGIPGNGHPKGEDLLFIVGASGSGKSSLARAGLIPAARRMAAQGATPGKESPAVWRFTILTPGSHPLEMLAASLTREAESVTAAATLMDDLRQDPRSLRLFLHKLPGPLFLVVDQFEELFTLCRDEEERRDFVDNLIAAAEGGRCKIVLTLRADFYAHCAQFENLRKALARSQEYIGPMSATDLRQAIEEPARQGGYLFEAGLVDLILRDAGTEPGTLPLLSHALLETWKHRQGRTLTLAGYAEAGGVHGAIAHTAEGVYARLTPEQQRIARSVFIRLTEFGEEMGGESLPAPDTRRRVAPEELVLHSEDRSRVEEVLNLLAGARLLTVGEESVEVAHEALIREWPALRGWLAEDRDGLRLHRRLTEAAQSWEELDCEPGELYRGARLAQAQEWAAAHPNDLNDMERDFLSASLALVEWEAAEREAARQREVEAARRLAESEQRRAEAEQHRAEEQTRTAQRFRWLAAGLAVLLLAAVALASLALQQRDRVRVQARLATSRELAASALGNLEVDPERSILLSLQALKNSDTQEAEIALHRSIQAHRLIRVFKAEYDWVIRLAASPDGKRLAVGSMSPSNELGTEIFDIASGERLLSLPGILAADTWPDGQRLATVNPSTDGKGVFTFWDSHTGQALSTLPDETPVQDVIQGNFSPDWTLNAEALKDGTTVISRLDNGERLFTLGKPGEAGYRPVEFSPDGKRLVALDGQSLLLWDVSTGREGVTLPSSEFGVWSAEFRPKEEQIALGMGPDVKIVDTNAGDIRLTLSGHTGFILGLRYSNDGTLLASGGSDRLAILWDALTGKKLMTLAGHTGELTNLEFIPSRSWLATSSLDGTVRLWDISTAGDREAASFDDLLGKPYTSIAYNPDGTRLAITGGSTPGGIFDAATGRPLLSLRGNFGKGQGSAAFSPDGTRLVTTSGEENAYLWDTATGKKLLTFTGHRGWIGDLAYSPDGQRIATIGFDGTARLWEVASGKELFSIQAFAEQLDTTQVIGIDFSPDGSRFATAAGLVPKVWDTRSGRELLALPAQLENGNSLAFSPDGRRLAIGFGLGEGANTWDLATGQKLADFHGHQGSINAILFSRDGERLITASVDGTIKIWDAATGQEQLTLARQAAQITGLALSADGTRLAATSDNGTARVYLLNLDDLIQAALQRLTRWLTPQECLEYLHSSTCPLEP